MGRHCAQPGFKLGGCTTGADPDPEYLAGSGSGVLKSWDQDPCFLFQLFLLYSIIFKW